MDLGERVGHTLVLGTTRVGKTRLAEILITQDIRRGDVVIVFDPKGDADLLRRVYAEAKRAGRTKDFYLFHLGFPEVSARYNAIGSLTPARQNPLDNVIAAAQSYDKQLWTALKVLAKGIWATILPLELSPDYSFAAIPLNKSPLEADVLSAILLIIVLAAIGFGSMKRRPVLSFGIFWHFITIFVKNRGNLKEIERELGLSYPTVRGRLNAVLRELGFGSQADPRPGPDELSEARQTIIERLNTGEISAEQAASELDALR